LRNVSDDTLSGERSARDTLIADTLARCATSVIRAGVELGGFRLGMSHQHTRPRVKAHLTA
jgi:hypothetical protein